MKSNKEYKSPFKKDWKLEGHKVDDEELSEFLDWSLVTGNKDYKTFKYLKETGYFMVNPITSEDLQKAALGKNR